MKTVILTEAMIQAGRLPGGYWNKRQLEAIGILWSELRDSGWIQRACGRTVSEADYATFVQLKGLSKKAAKIARQPEIPIPEADLPQPLQQAEEHLRSIARPAVECGLGRAAGWSDEVWEIVKRVRRRRGVAC